MLMVTVVSIRAGRSAVCVDDCGKSLTLPLDQLPVGAAVGSRLSLEAVLGLPATVTSRNRGAEKSGSPRNEPSALTSRAEQAGMTKPLSHASQGVGSALASNAARRMIVTEVRNRRDAVLVAENGTTMSRSILELPGKIRPGDVFLVAGAHAERDPDCERWSDACRRHSVARAQQLRLHPADSDPTCCQYAAGRRECARSEALSRSTSSPSTPVYGSPERNCQFCGWSPEEIAKATEREKQKEQEQRALKRRQEQELRELEGRQEQERILEALRRGDYRRPNEDWREHE